MDIVIRVSENDSKVWKVYKLTEICGGGVEYKNNCFISEYVSSPK